jgi:hypothetical protein
MGVPAEEGTRVDPILRIAFKPSWTSPSPDSARFTLCSTTPGPRLWRNNVDNSGVQREKTLE